MRLTRLHVDAPLAAGARVRLPEVASGHLRVLRATVGDHCVLFNGDGYDYEAHLVAVGKREAEAEVTARRAAGNESPLRIVLLQALARGEKMDWVVQKATELGVAAIVPVLSEHSEVRLDDRRAARRVAHWQGVVAAACEQSGRAVLPPVVAPLPLAQALAALDVSGWRLLLDPQGPGAIGTLGEPVGDVALAIGPEGGWSARDLATLHDAGFAGVRLGPRVLRTETAGLVAIAALQALVGDLR